MSDTAIGWIAGLNRPLGAKRFLTFVATSGTSAVLNLALRFLLSQVMIFEAALALAYVASTTLAFVLARMFVFEASGKRWHAELPRFVLVNVMGFLQVLVVSDLLLRVIFPWMRVTWHAEEIAHVLGLASLSLTSYQAHGRFSFRKARLTPAPIGPL